MRVLTAGAVKRVLAYELRMATGIIRARGLLSGIA
ncbi:hypothetical protein J2Z45_001401 [Cohnella lubricantis]|nr:hypothetical protein [Cohnella lubricantis]